MGHETCWKVSLGLCSDKISRLYIISLRVWFVLYTMRIKFCRVAQSQQLHLLPSPFPPPGYVMDKGNILSEYCTVHVQKVCTGTAKEGAIHLFDLPWFYLLP